MAESRFQRDLRLLQGRYEQRFEALIDRLVGGQLTTTQWRVAMENELRDLHLAATVVGYGPNRRLPDDVITMARRQANQDMQFLQRWSREFRQESLSELSLPNMKQRARLYARSAGETAWRASLIQMRLPEMPFFPKQDTICRRNCKCSWDIRRLQGSGNFDCFWRLAAVEHCPTCQARARAANPLQVRRGEIVNPERYRRSVLYA